MQEALVIVRRRHESSPSKNTQELDTALDIRDVQCLESFRKAAFKATTVLNRAFTTAYLIYEC